MLRAAAGLALAMILVTAPTGSVNAGEPTKIGITGGWPVSVTLEVGRRSITLNAHEGGGVTTVALDGPTVVRVRRLSDCVPVLRFVAQPGGTYWIYPGDGVPWVLDKHGGGTDSGPGFELQNRLHCPALPDSSTGPVPADRDGGLILVLVAVATVAFAGTLRRATSPGARRPGRGRSPDRP